MGLTGIFGGAFDPPHNGHVELARAARERFDLDPLLVYVVARPGHKAVSAPAAARLDLARAAFPGLRVALDEHAYSVEMLRDGAWDDPVFVIGADEWRDFASWHEPDEVLRRARVAVGTRHGTPVDVPPGDRVLAFEFDSPPFSSREIRLRIARGEPVDDAVPAAVAALIRELGLYRR